MGANDPAGSGQARGGGWTWLGVMLAALILLQIWDERTDLLPWGRFLPWVVLVSAVIAMGFVLFTPSLRTRPLGRRVANAVASALFIGTLLCFGHWMDALRHSTRSASSATGNVTSP